MDAAASSRGGPDAHAGPTRGKMPGDMPGEVGGDNVGEGAAAEELGGTRAGSGQDVEETGGTTPGDAVGDAGVRAGVGGEEVDKSGAPGRRAGADLSPGAGDVASSHPSERTELPDAAESANAPAAANFGADVRDGEPNRRTEAKPRTPAGGGRDGSARTGGRPGGGGQESRRASDRQTRAGKAPRPAAGQPTGAAGGRARAGDGPSGAGDRPGDRRSRHEGARRSSAATERPAMRSRQRHNSDGTGSSRGTSEVANPGGRSRSTRRDAGATGATTDGSTGSADVDAEDQASGETGDEQTRQARAPWHFKVLLVGTVVYLGWRLYQGIGWLVHHV
jgi:hypothetical protein